MADVFYGQLQQVQQRFKNHPNRRAVQELTAALSDCMIAGQKAIDFSRAHAGCRELTPEQEEEADALERAALDAKGRVEAALAELSVKPH